MRRTSRFVRTLGALGAMALIATACGGDEEEPGTGETTSPTEGTETPDDGETTDGEEGGEFSLYQCEPKRLIPQSTTESCGSQVLKGLFTPLVKFDPETIDPQWGDENADAVAESIEPNEDNTVWTVTLKEGWTFHDGTPVTAQDYVNAWNWGAYGPNAADGNYFFSDIEGYEELNPEEGEPSVEELSGLEVVDERTFRVTLNNAFSQYPLKLGYTVFYPLPEAAFEDMESYEEAPIGNGPYQMEGQWEHDQQIRMVRYEDYSGNRALADAVTIRIYTDINTAYNEVLAGNLDWLDTVPPERKSEAEGQFGDRYLTAPSSYFGFIGFPTYAGEPYSNPDFRKALSMALDRDAIVDNILQNGIGADDMAAPLINGYREGACGEACEYDPEGAAELLESIGGFEGTLEIWFNAGAGHEPVYEAVANMWRQNLGIESRFNSPQFAEILEAMEAEEITGPYRLAWVMDYPSMQNYLEPLHACGGSSNYTGYCNEEFDELVRQGNAAGSIEEATQLYQQADDILLQDLPVIPFYYREAEGVHGERISNVVFTPFEDIDLHTVQVSDG